jgi:hypothetical protein
MDKRIYKRWNLVKPLKIFDRESKKHLGELKDITIKGIGIRSELPLKLQLIVKLKIDLSGEDIKFKNLEIQGKCVWCQKKLTNLYFSGIKFEDLRADIIKNIKYLIYRYGFVTQNHSVLNKQNRI